MTTSRACCPRDFARASISPPYRCCRCFVGWLRPAVSRPRNAAHLQLRDRHGGGKPRRRRPTRSALHWLALASAW